MTRSFGSDRAKIGSGDHVPAVALRVPIMRALRELGGEAKSEDVLDRVANMVVLQRKDVMGTERRPDIPRWKNSAAWVRFELTQSGYVALKPGHKGVWQLTRKGEEFLSKEYDRSAATPLAQQS